MRAILSSLGLMFFLGTLASAQSINIPLIENGIDISSTVKSLRGAYIFDQHKNHLAGAFSRVVQFDTSAGVNMANVYGGAVWEVDNGIGGPALAFTVRGDNLVGRAFTNQWVKSHVKVAKMPEIEIGPFGGWIRRLGWVCGGVVMMGLGSK